jgi:hypothetical protein
MNATEFTVQGSRLNVGRSARDPLRLRNFDVRGNALAHGWNGRPARWCRRLAGTALPLAATQQDFAMAPPRCRSLRGKMFSASRRKPRASGPLHPIILSAARPGKDCHRIELRATRLSKARDLASRCRAAFTLVEILATLAFLGLVIPVTIKAILMATKAGETSERELIAEQLGENKLEELMINNAWTTAENRGNFDDRPGYRWELKKTDWQTGAMTELDLDVYFPVRGQEQSLRLSTLVNEQVGLPPDTTQQ